MVRAAESYVFDGADVAAPQQPRGAGGRRKSPRPVNPIAFYGTHVILGSVIGTAIGVYALVIARWFFGTAPDLVGHLWWLTILSGLGGMALIKSQMDAIRQTVFETKVDGKVQQLRIRRRPEVVMTLVTRAIVAGLVAFAILTLLHLGMQRYRAEFAGTTRPIAAPLPSVGEDVLLVMFSIVTAAATLTLCELTLRATHKEGFSFAALSLFVPATLMMGAGILQAMTFVK